MLLTQGVTAWEANCPSQTLSSKISAQAAHEIVVQHTFQGMEQYGYIYLYNICTK